jgi:hypothetical protein
MPRWSNLAPIQAPTPRRQSLAPLAKCCSAKKEWRSSLRHSTCCRIEWSSASACGVVECEVRFVYLKTTGRLGGIACLGPERQGRDRHDRWRQWCISRATRPRGRRPWRCWRRAFVNLRERPSSSARVISVVAIRAVLHEGGTLSFLSILLCRRGLR